MSLAIRQPQATYVRWGCRRCGHRGGTAKTTVPFDFSECQRDGSKDVLFKELIRALIRKHWQRQRCVAIETDFIIEECTPHGDRL